MAATQHSPDAPARLHDNVIPFPTVCRSPDGRAWDLAHALVDAAFGYPGLTSSEFATAAGIAAGLFAREAANV